MAGRYFYQVQSDSAPKDTPFPLSAEQSALLGLTRTDQAVRRNLAVAGHVLTCLDRTAFVRALAAVAARHPALRTILIEEAAELRQQVCPELEVDFAILDARTWSANELQRGLEEESLRPFDRLRGPLFRVRLFERARDGEVLLLVLDPLAADLWSVAVVVGELALLYEQETGGPLAELTPLTSTFQDFVLRQQDLLASERGERLRRYWLDFLKGGLPTVDIPVDRPRGARPEGAVASFATALGPEMTARLRKLGRGCGANLHIVLLSAFAMLLHRSTGQDRMVLGCPLNGRRERKLWNVVGPFAHLVPLRVGTGGAPGFAALVAQVGRDARAAFAHQDLPWEWLAERMRATEGEAGPFLQAHCEIRHAPHPRLKALARFGLGPPGMWFSQGRLHFESVDLPQNDGDFELALTAFVGDDGLHLAMRYRVELFDAVTAGRLVGRLVAGLAQAAADPHRSLETLLWIGEAERHQLLIEWTDTARPFRDGQCLQEWFEQQAALTPDAVALWYEGEACSYAELNRRANQLGHFLRSLGVGPEAVVGVCAGRSVELVVGLLGVLKAGGAYLPLDPTYPVARLQLMMEDSRITVLLTQESLLATLPETGAEIISLDRDWERIACWPEDTPESEAGPENLAYVIYTSGSTGRPKGVMVQHRGVLNLVAVFIERLGLDESSRVLQFSSLSFDVSVRDVFETLLAGSRLILASRERLLPGAGLFELMQECGVTAVTLPPAAIATLEGESELSELRTLTAGGEACGAELVDRWAPGRRFFNAYGPTETTVCSTLAECEAGAGKPTIGRPLANTKVYVLDRALRPAGIGVVGELYIGGVGVSRGYLGRPGLTAERFLPDEWSGRAGDRLYRTGDLVRYRGDGQLDYLGRTDHQVKVRGFRIELGEVETVLASHPGVREVAVMARPGPDGGLRLVAYVVSRAPGLNHFELRDFAGRRLPEYMVPAAFVRLEALPLTGAGKVDRQALPEPERAGGEESFTPPREGIEQFLAALWEKLLGVPRIGAHDNFFELGGHSLLAAQVLGRVREDLGAELPLSVLLSQPTVAELASEIEKRKEGAA